MPPETELLVTHAFDLAEDQEDDWDASGYKAYIAAAGQQRARFRGNWRWLDEDPHLDSEPVVAISGLHHVGPSSRQAEFDGLADRWAEDSMFWSNLTQIHMHPAYQRIIGMGPEALPMILQRLAHEGGHWFWALASISGEDAAVGSESISDARNRWLEWGEKQGYVRA